jgi:hydrogenase-1 operon protein HyaF
VSGQAGWADDGLVDALLMEIAGRLASLVERGEASSIDLRGLPLSDMCLADLEQRLGRGEISVRLDAAGISEIHETGFSGVWWSRHADETGRVIAMLVEITAVPDILRTDPRDMVRSLQRLPDCTHAASFAKARQRR